MVQAPRIPWACLKSLQSFDCLHCRPSWAGYWVGILLATGLLSRGGKELTLATLRGGRAWRQPRSGNGVWRQGGSVSQSMQNPYLELGIKPDAAEPRALSS